MMTIYRSTRSTVRQAREADRLAARKRIEQGTHGLVLHVQGDRNAAEVADLASRALHWWEDLRTGKNKIYGSLLRFLDIAIAAGVPRETLLQVPQWISFYIVDRCEDRDRRAMHRPPAA